ncbi:MAG: hypothetical protein O3C63_01065 [Cyanobacteria bacterium]|nr:hypothetical protein [Cyanobacteriota bacterium]MDA1021036.1 hypothetical protein [Cyanobacteriota bacterium]
MSITHQLSLLLSCFALSSSLVQAASLRSFSKPITKPVKQVKAKPRRQIEKTIHTAKATLGSAILVELPSYKSLTRKFTNAELEFRDQKALSLLLEAAIRKDPELVKAQKDSQNSFRSRTKEIANDYLNERRNQIKIDYLEFANYYQERYQLDNKTRKLSIRAAERLQLECGQEAVSQTELLIKGGR